MTKQRNKKTTGILAGILLTSMVFFVPGLQARQEENVQAVKTNLSKIERNKQEPKETKPKFEYKFIESGGTSSAIVATIDGVDHVFGWGNNDLGQLGVGYQDTSIFKYMGTDDGVGKEGLKKLNTYISRLSPDNPFPNSIKALPTPEDINVDGGASGIQGEVVDVVMGEGTTYIAIRPDGQENIDIWTTGTNIYGQLGNGYGQNWIFKSPDRPNADDAHPNQISDKQSIGYGYRTGWEKIKFYGQDGQEVFFKEINSLASYKSTILSAVDMDGNERVFAWGWGGSGSLGTGSYGTLDNYNSHQDSMREYDFVHRDISDEPLEITDNFLLPKLDASGNVKYDSSLLPDESQYGVGDLNYNTLLNNSSMNYIMDPDPSKVYTTDDLSYPFETTSLQDGGWYISSIVASKTANYFEATNKQFGTKVMFQAGQTKGATSSIFRNTGSGNWSTIPLIWYWDGMPSEYLFKGSDIFPAGTDMSLIDYSISPSNISLALRIDGRDHLINFNVYNSTKELLYTTRFLSAPSDYKDETGATFNGNGIPINPSTGDKYKDGDVIVSDVNLGYMFDDKGALTDDFDSAVTMGLKPGDEIVQVFTTSDAYRPTTSALIKTKDPKGKDVYSLVGWGSNAYSLLDDEFNETAHGLGAKEIDDTPVLVNGASKSSTKAHWGNNTTLWLTTAQTQEQLADNYLLSGKNLHGTTQFQYTTWDRLVKQGRTFHSTASDGKEYGFFRDQYDGQPNSEGNDQGEFLDIDPSVTYTIENVTGGGTSVAFDVNDGTKKYRYYMGNNEDKQISSSISANKISSPVALYIASFGISDSFKLNTATAQQDGIDFSVDAMHGGEIEQFQPDTPNTPSTGETIDTSSNAIRFYGDLDHSGRTDIKTEEIGTNKTISGGKTGKLEYIGRGSKNLGSDEKKPEYDTTIIPAEDQIENLYKERYNFRVTGLQPNASYGDLYVSINNHNPVRVAGTLKTQQLFKYVDSSERMSFVDSTTDSFKFQTQLMYDIPGYADRESSEALTEQYIKDNTVIYFEDQLGNSFSNNKALTKSTKEVNLEVSDLGKPGKDKPENGSLQIGETPYGQDVTLTVSGDSLQADTKYFNFKMFIDDGSNQSIWENSNDYSSMTIVNETDYIKTAKLAEIKETVKLISYDEINNEAKFSLDIRSGDYADSIGNKDKFSIIDPSTVTLTSKAKDNIDAVDSDVTFSNVTMDLDSKNPTSKATLTVGDVKANTTYHDAVISVKDKSITPKDVTQNIAGEFITDAKESDMVSSAKTAATTPGSDVAAIEIVIREHEFNKEYEQFNYKQKATITGKGSKGTTTFDSEFISVKDNGDGTGTYTYEITGFQGGESMKDFKMGFTDGSNSKTFNIATEINSAKQQFTMGNVVEETGHTQNSISLLYKFSSTTSWADTESIDWSKSSMKAKLTKADGTSSTVSIDQSNTSNGKVTTNGLEKELTFTYSLDANATIEITEVSIFGTDYGMQTEAVSLSSKTDALEAEIVTSTIDASSIVATDNSITINGFETLSSATDKQYASISKMTATIKGGSNIVNGTKVADTTIELTSLTKDVNNLAFTGLDANVKYTSIEISVEDNLAGYPDASITINLPSEARTASKELKASSFTEGDLSVNDEKGTATYSWTVADSTSTEDIDTTNFNIKDDLSTEGGVKLTAAPVDSNTDATWALNGVGANASYDQKTGLLEINFSGLKNNVVYTMAGLKLDVIDTDASTADSNLLSLAPTKTINTQPIPFNKEGVTIQSIDMDNNTYLDSELTLHLEDIVVKGNIEDFDWKSIDNFKDSNGNVYTVSPTNPWTGTETPSTDGSGNTIISDLTVNVVAPAEAIGTNITFVSYEYDSTTITMNNQLNGYASAKKFTPQDSKLYSSNVEYIASPTDKLILDLGATDETGLNYAEVEFTTITIDGTQYDLVQTSSKSASSYEVVGYQSVDLTTPMIEAINGETLSTPIEIGNVNFNEIPKSSNLLWLWIILSILSIIGILLLVLFLLWWFIFRMRVTSTTKLTKTTVEFTITKDFDSNFLSQIEGSQLTFTQDGEEKTSNPEFKETESGEIIVKSSVSNNGTPLTGIKLVKEDKTMKVFGKVDKTKIKVKVKRV